MKTVDQVLAAFESAALKEGLKRNTRKIYALTIKEFSGLLKAGKISGPQGYFDYLSTVKKVSPDTVHHALNPLNYLYEKVLEKEFGEFKVPRRNRKKPMRSVLMMSDVLRMMELMDRIPRLQTGLLGGGGMRIESDMLTLRLKDVRIGDRIITIHEAKGGKTRPIRIPEIIVPELEAQMLACRKQWEKDRQRESSARILRNHSCESSASGRSERCLGIGFSHRRKFAARTAGTPPQRP